MLNPQAQQLVDDFTEGLAKVTAALVAERVRSVVNSAFAGGDKPAVLKKALLEGVVPAAPRKARPRQICPVPGCRNTAAPIFGMVCSEHKGVAKSLIRKYRQERREARREVRAGTKVAAKGGAKARRKTAVKVAAGAGKAAPGARRGRKPGKRVAGAKQAVPARAAKRTATKAASRPAKRTARLAKRKPGKPARGRRGPAEADARATTASSKLMLGQRRKPLARVARPKPSADPGGAAEARGAEASGEALTATSGAGPGTDSAASGADGAS